MGYEGSCGICKASVAYEKDSVLLDPQLKYHGIVWVGRNF